MPRVALTTTRDRGAALASRCEGLGVEPVLLPCIRFSPADDAVLESVRKEAVGSDWILVTSPRAIQALWPAGGMPGVPVAAVGGSTSDVVSEAGGRPVVVGDGGADDLVGLLAGKLDGRTVVFPHAAGAGQATAQSLETAGASVVAGPVYEISPAPPATDPVDAVAFGSPTAVRGWHMSRDLEGLVVGAIGETTARELAGHAAQVDVVPPKPSLDHLVELIAEHLRDRSAV